ncbi:MAG: hypothetical protein ACI9NQ_001710 [Paracoccaceae bacterium]
MSKVDSGRKCQLSRGVCPRVRHGRSLRLIFTKRLRGGFWLASQAQLGLLVRSLNLQYEDNFG